MPFLRFSRDKRGYEHTYLVQSTNRRGKPVRPRVLYWFRTPPGVRLGREPFDQEVRRMLEAQNPGIAFDWGTIVKTVFPAAEPEHWRERRRAERAARQSRREEEDEDSAADAPSEAPGVSADQAPSVAVTPLAVDEAGRGAGEGIAAATESGSLRKRRHRGGRRRRSGTGVVSAEGLTEVEARGDQPLEPRVSLSEDQE